MEGRDGAMFKKDLFLGMGCEVGSIPGVTVGRCRQTPRRAEFCDILVVVRILVWLGDSL